MAGLNPRGIQGRIQDFPKGGGGVCCPLQARYEMRGGGGGCLAEEGAVPYMKGGLQPQTPPGSASGLSDVAA